MKCGERVVVEVEVQKTVRLFPQPCDSALRSCGSSHEMGRDANNQRHLLSQQNSIHGRDKHVQTCDPLTILIEVAPTIRQWHVFRLSL